jgi:hypothetical protein
MERAHAVVGRLDSPGHHGASPGLDAECLEAERHRRSRTLHWIRASAASGKPWVVCNDEQNPAEMGIPSDPGYAGHSGEAFQGNQPYTLHDIRKSCLWGTLMAGGGGVEYCFGYPLPQNDLVCEDWRSRDRSWDYGRLALDFFRDHRIPFWEMQYADALVGNPANDNSKYCFAKAGELYLVYLPNGEEVRRDLTGASGGFAVHWFHPRSGGALQAGSVRAVNGGASVLLGRPPGDAEEDWLVLVRRETESNQ